MPIYEYACSSCGKEFEELVGINDPAPGCPACQGREVRKKVSASAFVLKGGGWYKDHYGLKGSSASSGGESSSSSSSASAPAAPSTPAPTGGSSGGSSGSSGGTAAA
jgi:putative FmdB family regulatory protein